MPATASAIQLPFRVFILVYFHRRRRRHWNISTHWQIGAHKYIVLLLLFMDMKYDFIVVHLSNENGLAEQQRNANKMFTSLSEIKTDSHTLAFSRFDANISLL